MGPLIDLWRRERGARPYFGALAAGALGTGAGYVAIMLVAYERLGTAWAASLMLLADMLPAMLLGPLLGAWLDRRDRLRWAIAADVVRAAALAGMLLIPGPVSLLAFALLTGFATAIFRPAAFALVSSVVAPERTAAANAAWGAVQDAGMLLGPALAGGVLALGSSSLLLAVNAAAFALSAALLTRVRLAQAPERVSEDSLVEETKAGLRFVVRDPIVRVLVLGNGATVVFAGMINVAEILLARRELHVGGAGFAAMVAVFGIGTVAGSLASAHSESVARLRTGYLAGLAISSAGMLGSALAPSLALVLPAFAVTGFGGAVAMAHDRGLLRRLVPEHMLSRVYGLYGTIDAWGFAASALLGGTVASLWGARGVFAVAGTGALVIAAIAARTLLRPSPLPEPVPA